LNFDNIPKSDFRLLFAIFYEGNYIWVNGSELKMN